MSEAPTVTGALEQVSGAQRMIDAANFAARLPQNLPAEKFQHWAVHLLSRPELVEVARTDAGRLSIIKALMDCASLGLEPGREFHLVPFSLKDEHNIKQPPIVVGITDYKGEIRLITNARRCSVIAQLVRKGDTFYMRAANAPPLHEPPDASTNAEAWFDTSRPVIGGYAYCAYPGDEYSMVIRMSEQEFLHHRAKARTTNVWDEWPEAQRLKTLAHQLRKWVPWSAEWVPS
jgi:recombination protein RecT